jgi:hypothetical protein
MPREASRRDSRIAPSRRVGWYPPFAPYPERHSPGRQQHFAPTTDCNQDTDGLISTRLAGVLCLSERYIGRAVRQLPLLDKACEHRGRLKNLNWRVLLLPQQEGSMLERASARAIILVIERLHHAIQRLSRGRGAE